MATTSPINPRPDLSGCALEHTFIKRMESPIPLQPQSQPQSQPLVTVKKNGQWVLSETQLLAPFVTQHLDMYYHSSNKPPYQTQTPAQAQSERELLSLVNQFIKTAAWHLFGRLWAQLSEMNQLDFKKFISMMTDSSGLAVSDENLKLPYLVSQNVIKRYKRLIQLEDLVQNDQCLEFCQNHEVIDVFINVE